MAGPPAHAQSRRYTGSSAYCYSNSLHMALVGAGADPSEVPDVGFLECLTTQPFGNLFIQSDAGPLPLFSNGGMDPDAGLSHALQALGWTCQDSRGGNGGAALARLRAAVQDTPALAGPLDMGHLTHNPRHAGAAGADHFVVVLQVDDAQVRFHDPGGFPFATLPIEQFLLAWRAERVDYAPRPYVLRSGFHQADRRSRQEMIHQGLPAIRAGLVADPGGPVRYGGLRALQLCAEALRAGVSVSLAAHLRGFALPLAARRRADAAVFMEEAGNGTAAGLLAREAHLFGAAQYPAAQGWWQQVACLLDELTAVEETLIASV